MNGPALMWHTERLRETQLLVERDRALNLVAEQNDLRALEHLRSPRHARGALRLISMLNDQRQHI